jgi:hypothetical protein
LAQPGGCYTWLVTPVRLALVGALLVLLVLLLRAQYLPMIDLPQHAAQIASWLRLGDPASPDHRLYELNLHTPYLGAYSLARLLAPLLGVVPALKVVIWLAIAGSVLALESLARATGHSPWLGVLALPTALGYSFYFGFVSFLFAIPLALFSWRLALAHAAEPKRSSALGLSSLLAVTFAAHPFAFALAVGGSACLLLEGLSPRQGLRAAALRFAPLLPAAVLFCSWLPSLWHFGNEGGEVWQLGLARLRFLPALLMGIGPSEAVLGALILGALALQLGKPHGHRARQLPLLFVLLGFLLLPLQLRSVGFVYPRLAAFVLPSALLAFRARRTYPSFTRWAPSLLALAVCGLWLTSFGLRLRDFQREAEPFSKLVSAMPAGLAVRPIVFERECRSFPGVSAFLHFPAYYQVERGGTQGYSFARYAISVIRERTSAESDIMQNGAEWRPQDFEPEREVVHFDFFAVHSQHDRTSQLFGASTVPVRLVAHFGDWWGYTSQRL